MFLRVFVVLALTMSMATAVNWVNVHGLLRSVSIGPAGIWGANKYDTIYYRTNTYHLNNVTGSGWKSTDGDYWVHVCGLLKHVSVSNQGHVWGVNSKNQIFIRMGANNCNPGGDYWTQIHGSLIQISAGFSGVWGVNSNHHIFYRKGTYGDTGSKGTGWTHVGGSLKYVSSGDGVVIGVNYKNEIFIRKGVSFKNPTGRRWTKLNGLLSVVDGFDRSLYVGVNHYDKIFHS